MKNNKLILIFSLLIVSINVAAQKQQDEPASRSITSLDFSTKREKVSVKVKTPTNPPVRRAKRKKNVAVVSNSKRRYNLVKSVKATASLTKQTAKTVLKNEELGVTFWRLRPLIEDEDDDAPTFSVILGEKRENWTAERVNSTTEFQIGDRVRFTIESSRAGYLYIVNREFYTDGSTGDASLIFPTLRTRGGDNSVSAGTLIEVPGANDSVPYFTIKPQRKDYAGEELVVIISPIKIPGIELEKRAQRITREKVEKWLEDWGARVDIYDAADGMGIAYTAEEAEAANSTSRALTQEEPLPQTLYKAKVRSDLPFIVPFQMQAETP
jgi:hypothetical protein